MPVSKVFSSAVAAVFLGGASAFAQGFGGNPIPADFPPASFTGKQYVDSKGCAYIRAGVDGNVTWVPRVTRTRQPICGLQPTFAKAAPKDTPSTKVAQAPALKPAPVTVKPVPAVAAKPAVNSATPPMRTVASITTPPKRMMPQAVPVTVAAPRRAAPAQLEAPAVVSGCAQLGASAQYMQGSGLRCGPQAEAPITYGTGNARAGAAPNMQIVTTASVQPGTRIVPKHVHDLQVEATNGVRIPKGYRPVWTDDRLNPKRAHQTAGGKASMDLIWTQTVPRRLIDQRTGRDVTRANPNLVYPYTDLATQQRTKAFTQMQSAQVSSKGTVENSRTKVQVNGVSQKYVQVGTFGVPANAQRTAARLQQAGLPVRMASFAKGGKQYQIVLAGPFASGQQLGAALNTARGAGFRDAFVR